MLEILKGLLKRPSDKDKFADKMQKLLARRGKQASYEAEGFLLRGADGLIIYLENVYTDWSRMDPATRDGELEKFFDAMTQPEPPADFETARASLLPVMRNVVGLDLARIGEMKQGQSDLWEAFAMTPFSPCMAVGVAHDTEASIQQIGDKTMAGWGKPLAEVMAAAMDNLRAKAPPSFTEDSPGFYLSNYNDFYDATRILLPELCQGLPLRGRPVAMIPNRICLLLAGDQDEAALGAMIATARRVLTEHSRPLTAEMFRLDDNKQWQLWEPQGENGTLVNNLLLEMQAADYASQKEALDAEHEKTRTDVFVASYKLVKRPGSERIESFAVLTKDAATLLPRADRIVVNDLDSKEQLFVPWAAFEARAGHLLEALPYVLPRYRVKRHPNAEELAALREVAEAS